MKRTAVAICSFLLIAIPAIAEIGIEATINPSRAIVGEPMTLSVVVNGASNVRPPKLPNLPNFRSYSQGHSQEMSFINGRMSSRSIFSYVLIPMAPGKQVLGQLEVDIDGRIYKTGVLEVEVIDRSSPSASSPYMPPPPTGARAPVVPPAPRSLPPEYLSGKDIFVRAWVDKEDVYVNQPVYLTYTVYTRVSATFKGFEKEPETTGFWVEEFPPAATTANRQEKEIGGYRYVVADVRTVALFPSEAGTIKLDPGILKVDAEVVQRNSFDNFYSSDIFGWRTRRAAPVVTEVVPRLLATDPIHINVKPLPAQGKPADFSGAVGRYQLEASVDRSDVEEGEPITYKLRLFGEGNINMTELPKLPAMDYFKMYESTNTTNVNKDRLVVEGERMSETVVIPKKRGSYTMPAQTFSYFDPGKREYVTLKSREIPITVRAGREEAQTPVLPEAAPAPQEAPLLGEDVRFVKAAPGRLVPERAPLLTSTTYAAANAGILLFALFLFAVRLIAEKAAPSAGTARLRRSHRVARERLRKAKQHLRKGAEKEFYEALSNALYGYFADKFNLGPGEISMELVESRLKGRVSDAEFDQLKDIVNQIHYGRFAGAQASLDDMKKLFAASDKLITQLEAKRI